MESPLQFHCVYLMESLRKFDMKLNTGSINKNHFCSYLTEYEAEVYK
jgi:hypothetical protein